jgi:pimeloyl-ACP methyl ester carboxylesterase
MPTINLTTHQLHFLDTGSGRPLILLHGLGSRADHWQPQIDTLSQHYRVICPDSRGHGQSTTAAAPYQIAALATDVLALMEHLSLDAADIIGYSLGGMVGFELAINYPQRINSLTVINSGPHVPSDNWFFKVMFWQRFLMIRFMSMEKLGKVVAKKLFPKPQQKKDFQDYVDSMKITSKCAYRATLKAFKGWSVLNQVNTIHQPALVVTGDQDYTPVAAKRYYAGLMPNARMEVIANSTHATPIDQPAELNRLLLKFLAEHN